MKILLRLILAITLLHAGGRAQSVQKAGNEKQTTASAAELELKQFFAEYGEDIRQARREAIANRYDSRGYFSVGNGVKSYLTFDETKERYLKRWTGPKSFEWKDLSFELLSPTSAAAAGLFDIEFANGQKATYSYSASLIKQSGKWKIRVEDESANTSGYTTRTTSGDRNTPGVWKYSLTAQPGAAISAHRHNSDMKVTVASGRKFILMGDLDTAKVQIFEKGSTFVIPANAWHVEWWETETVEEIEITVPMRTERASPATPRGPTR
jgi:quercetin dioxygenase-like cupin family protein